MKQRPQSPVGKGFHEPLGSSAHPPLIRTLRAPPLVPVIPGLKVAAVARGDGASVSFPGQVLRQRRRRSFRGGVGDSRRHSETVGSLPGLRASI